MHLGKYGALFPRIFSDWLSANIVFGAVGVLVWLFIYLLQTHVDFKISMTV